MKTTDAITSLPAIFDGESQPKAAAPRFAVAGTSVVRGTENICVARSANMAARIAAALNWYKPGPRGH